MTQFYPREPHAGDRISAQLVRDIIRCLRRITPLPGPGCNMRFTPNGTFIQAAGGSGGGGSYTDNGCWKLVRETSGETETLKFENQFYQIGGQIHEGSDNTNLYTLIKQGDLSEGQEYTSSDKPYIYLVVYATSANGYTAGEMEIRGKKEWSELMADADDAELYVKPLYKLTHDGGIDIDFRNMPQLAMNETAY